MSITSASLGIYEADDTITYTVVCLSNEGARDPDCTGMSNDILDPDDTTRIAPLTDLVEVSDANFPGLWRGSYNLNESTVKIGTWSIYLQLTNANGTVGGTVLNFEVVSGKWSTQDNITDLNSSNTNIINHGDIYWYDDNESLTRIEADLNNPTQYMNITGAACVTLDETINGNTTGAVCVTVEDKTGYSLTTQDWTTSNDLNISLLAQALTDNATREQILT